MHAGRPAIYDAMRPEYVEPTLQPIVPMPTVPSLGPAYPEAQGAPISLGPPSAINEPERAAIYDALRPDPFQPTLQPPDISIPIPELGPNLPPMTSRERQKLHDKAKKDSNPCSNIAYARN